jgi:hypothetical protein
VTVNDPSAIVPIYIVPFPISAAALAVVGDTKGTELMLQLGAVTAVLVAPAVSVNVPVAFDRPAASCCIERANLAKSFSCVETT